MPAAYYTEIILAKAENSRSPMLFHHIVTCVCKVKTRWQSIQQPMGSAQLTHAEVVIQLLLGEMTAEKDSILYRKVNAFGLLLVDQWR